MRHLLLAPQQESFLPFSFWQSLSCCLSCMAKRSTPEPHGPPYSFLQNRVVLLPFQNHVVLFIPYSLYQNHVDLYLSTCFRTSWFPLLMAAAPRFKSQCPSSFAAPFLTPPTVSYTCQHPRILPVLLGCHCKSVQVWPHGMQPIISKLSRRPCNQGELLPSPILHGICSHPPGSKYGHSCLTYL